LSAQIAEIEIALGVSLFERDRRGVILTPAGQEIVERARRVLVSVDDVLDAAGRLVDPLTGTLRIGVIPTIGPYLLPRIAPALHEAYPRLTLVWIEDKTETLVRSVGQGKLDAALLALEADLGDLDNQFISKDPFVVAAPPGHRLVQSSSPLSLRQLRGERVLLLDDGHCFRDQVIEYCSSTGIEELGFRATSLSTLAQMVASGTGITLLPSIAVPTESQRAALAVRALAAPEPTRTIVLGWRKRSALAGTLHKIAETIRQIEDAQGHARPPARPRPRRKKKRSRKM
jgi:LysR family hydrogen peroxide-inducible transcriptional activator